jgi:hypothetical protein
LFFRAVLCFLNFTDCTSRTAVFWTSSSIWPPRSSTLSTYE